MKKAVLILAFLFASTFLFAEATTNLRFGLDTASPPSYKPLVGLNIAVDHTWKDFFGFGAGIKGYYNIKKQDYEKPLCGGPYAFLKIYDGIAGIGIFYTNVSELSVYLNLGGIATFYENQGEKFGLELGVEVWYSGQPTILAEQKSKTYASDAEYNSIKPSDSCKVYIGLTYSMPL